MIRLVRVFLFAFLLMPQFTEVTLRLVEHCEEAGDCCGGVVCDPTCPQCPCCFSNAPGTAVSSPAIPRLALPSETVSQSDHLRRHPDPSDILHVPRPTRA